MVATLEGVAEFQMDAQERQKKRKHAEKPEKSRKRAKRLQETPGTEQAAQATQAEVDDAEDEPPIAPEEPAAQPPPILQHVIVGINECTKDLEGMARAFRETLPAQVSDHSTPKRDSCPRIVLVCRGDVDPPILIGHIPSLVAACNSARHRLSDAAVTWLVPLSKGSESSLAAAMGLRRTSVMVIKVSY